MNATTPLSRAKAQMLKSARTAIRLKHSIQADEEIATELPELEKRFDTAMALGQDFEVSFDEFLAA